MKKLLLAALAVGSLTVGTPAAQADHTGWTGNGCSFATLNDTTGQLGGQNQWNGALTATATATSSGDPAVPQAYSITIECELLINGSSQGIVASASGLGTATTTSQFSFTAEETDVVTLCDIVTVDGEAQPVTCGDATTTQVIPQPVIDVLNTVMIDVVDPTLCPTLATLQGDYAGVVTINDQGDVFVLGTPQWDCPPYDLFPPD